MRWLATALLGCLLFWPRQGLGDRAVARQLVSEGQKFSEAGRWQLALERYEKAMVTEPDYLPSYELALPLWMRMGRLQTAQARLERLTLRCADCAFAWYALGALYRKSGRFDWAVLAYEAYLAQRPDDPDAHFGLAMALSARGDAAAAQALRRYLRLEKRDERSAYRQQAQRILDKIGGSELEPVVEPTTAQDPSLAHVESLVRQGRLDSAQALLNRLGATGRAALHLRARIAGVRGQPVQEAGFLAIAWLMASGSAP